MRIYSTVAVVLLVSGGLAAGTAGAAPRSSHLITRRAVGPVRLGMTVAEARRVLPGLRVTRSSNGEGVAYVGVFRGKNLVMQLFTGEDDPDTPVDNRRKIQSIDVFEARYHTAAGVYPGMRLSAAERRLGKVKEIRLTEIEAQEFAEFTRPQPGYAFLVGAPSGWAGNYGRPNATSPAVTRKYVPGARIRAILLTGG